MKKRRVTLVTLFYVPIPYYIIVGLSLDLEEVKALQPYYDTWESP